MSPVLHLQDQPRNTAHVVQICQLNLSCNRLANKSRSHRESRQIEFRLKVEKKQVKEEHFKMKSLKCKLEFTTGRNL